jgi:soluble lytic murein transglycosylase-like protein
MTGTVHPIGSLVRLTAGVLGLIAVVLFAAARPVVPSRLRAAPPPAPAAAPVAAESAPTRTWSLQVGGWTVRVDGPEVDLPTLAQQTAAPGGSRRTWVSISPFDQLIAYHASAEGFDWRLVAALIAEESGFDPASRSDKGAYGLMQVRPIAADAVGADDFASPDDNVQTGVRYLRQLNDMFSDVDAAQRLQIVLAAYNIGPGHMRDAQALARQLGLRPDRWYGHLEQVLPLLEDPSVYRALPSGFAQGRTTVAYVDRILQRYREYQQRTAGWEQPDAASPPAPDAEAGG